MVIGVRAARWGVVVAVAVGFLGLAACGGADATERGLAGGSQILAGLRITTVALPVGHVDEVYETVRLEAEGPASGALTWSLWEGELPAGLRLEPDGRLHGTPREAGFSVFAVHATDGTLAGTGTLALAVDAFGVAVQAGLVGGDAWSGRPVTLRTAGQEGGVQFELVRDESGASLADVDATAGTATLWPGGVRDGVATDVVRATDLGTGRWHEVAVDVCPDPLAGHVARFGSSDVWYLNPNHKDGAHPYATDLHAALARTGLRDPDSTDTIGTPTDRLAETWIRLEMLRYLNTLYLRDADGGPAAAGLPVSFPFHEPGAGYYKPERGAWLDGAPNRFSEMALIDGVVPGVVGTAFIDDTANTLHENDTSVTDTQLGVFVNVVSGYFRTSFPYRELREEPLDAADYPVLRALLHDLPSPGGRYDLIAGAGRDFAHALASVAAHEIGHSLGLEHTQAGDPRSIMNPAATISPWTKPTFTAQDLARLRARLPGPGRYAPPGTATKPVGTSAVHAPALPAGGVSVCSPRRCDWRLPCSSARSPAPGR